MALDVGSLEITLQPQEVLVLGLFVVLKEKFEEHVKHRLDERLITVMSQTIYQYLKIIFKELLYLTKRDKKGFLEYQFLCGYLFLISHVGFDVEPA